MSQWYLTHFNLTLLLVPLILTLTFVYQDKEGVIYVPISCFVSALIIFLNFPSIVIFLHSRPIYYNDLILTNYDEEGHIYQDEFRKKYQKIFQWIISVSSAIMVGVTAELWFYRDSMFISQSEEKNQLRSYVILGIIGGLLRIYYGAAMLLGNLLLLILKKLKRREQERLRMSTEERTLVELTSIGVTISEEDSEPFIHQDNIPLNKVTPILMTDIFN